MPKRCKVQLIDSRSSLKEEFNSIKEAAQFVKLTGISNSKIKNIHSCISYNLSGKCVLSFGRYQFKHI